MRSPPAVFARPLSLARAVLACAACAALAACAKRTEAPSGSPVVAKVGDVTITVDDLQQRINTQPPFVRARYASPEKKKEMLDEMVRLEVLAAEAKRRGYDRDPTVLHAMKQQMVTKLLEHDFESKNTPAEVSDDEIEKYYDSHAEEFHRKAEVRIAGIFVSDQGKVQRAYAEAKALPSNPGGDPRGFRDLATRYSDEDLARRFADEHLFFAEDSAAYPKPVVEAAFRLHDVGEITPPIAFDGGWAILELTQKRPAFDRTVAEAKPEIQQRLFRDVRAHALDAYVADLTRKAKSEEHDELLDRVVVPSAGAAARSPFPQPPR
jgi:peptidyl-prolyl cis-trans isomerase C